MKISVFTGIFCLCFVFTGKPQTVDLLTLDSTLILEAPQEMRNGMLYSNFVKIKTRNDQVIPSTSSSQRHTGTTCINAACAGLKVIFDSYAIRAGGDPNSIEFQRYYLDDFIPQDKARNIFSVYLHAMVNLDSIITDLRAIPEIEIVNPPYILLPLGIPVFDTGVVPNPFPNWHVNKIQAPEAWTLMQPFISTPQQVAIVDDGQVWGAHNELINRVAPNNYCQVIGSHATMVGSCISANACSSACPGPIGIAQNFVNLTSHVALKGSCQPEEAFLNILNMPAATRPSVINCSFVFLTFFSHPPFPPLRMASKFQSYQDIQINLISLEQLIIDGQLVVAACGNSMSASGIFSGPLSLSCPSSPYCFSQRGIGYPFGLPGVIGVGATAPDYSKNPNFEYGMGSGNDPDYFFQGTSSGGNWNYNYNDPTLSTTIDINNQNVGYMEIVAPGSHIDVAKYSANSPDPTQTGFADGSSFASPIAAGVAASMYLVNSSLNTSDVTRILLETADKVGYNPNGLELGDLNSNASFAKGYKYSNTGDINNGGFYNNNIDYVMGNGRVNMLSAVMNAAGLNTGGVTIDSASHVIVRDVNDHSYLIGNNYNEAYEYDAILNQNGVVVRFSGQGTLFNLSENATFRVSNGATMAFVQNGNLLISSGTQNHATKYIVGNNGTLQLSDRTFNIHDNSLLEVNPNGTLSLNNGSLVIEAGATLHIKSGANVNISASGNLLIQQGAYVCIEQGVIIVNNGTINFASGINIGVNPIPNLPNASSNCLAPCNIMTSTNYSGTGFLVTASCISFSNVAIRNESCTGGGDGFISVDVTGGNPPYTYLWTPTGQTTQTAVGLFAGTYILTVTDSTSDTLEAAFVVAGPSIITLNTSTTDVFCAGGSSSGTANVIPSGGSQPYTFSWSNGQTTQTITGLSVGNYIVTATDAVNCFAIDTVTVSNSPTNSPMSVTISQTNVSCNGGNDGSAAAVISGGTAPFNSFWVSGSTGNVAGNELTTDTLSAGIYILIISDATGCFQKRTVTITQPSPLKLSVPPPPFILPLPKASSCHANDGRSQVIVSGGTTPYLFSWNTSPPQNTSIATGLAVGLYSATVTDINGCKANIDVSIGVYNVNAPWFIQIKSHNITCNGRSDGIATAIVSGGVSPFNYLWSPNTGNQTTKSVSGLSPGTYFVRVVDASNECNFASVSITEPAELSFDLFGTGADLCNGGTRTGIATGGTPPYQYTWYPSGQTTQTATSLQPGTHYASVTDANGCKKQSYSFVKIPQNLPNLTFSIATTHASGCGNADGIATVTNINNGTFPYTYSWSNGQNTQTATGLIAGTYSITVSDATGSSGCITSGLTTITNLNSPVLTIQQNNLTCSGKSNNGSATVMVSGGTPPFTYSWNTVPVQTSETATGLSAGTYSILVADNIGSCNIASVTINPPAPLVLFMTSTQPTCTPGNDGTATIISVSGGTFPFTYAWSQTAQTTKVATGLTAGVYTATVTDALGCKATDSLTVNTPGLNFYLGKVDVSCSGGSDGKTYLGGFFNYGTPPYTYLWSNGSQTTSAISGLTDGNYTLTVGDAGGCSDIKTVPVTQPAQIVLSTTSTGVSNCLAAPNGTAIVNASGGTPPYTYLWSTVPVQKNKIAIGLAAGTYTATVRDANDCYQTTTINVVPVPALMVTSTQTNILCKGLCNGSASITGSGGTPLYFYKWSNGAVTSTISNLCAGIYTGTVKDAYNCFTTATVIITQPAAALSVTTMQTNVPCDGSCTGEATAEGSGGTGPYTYKWSTGATNLGLKNLCAGTYIITVRDNNNCVVNATITQPAVLLAVVTQTNVTCNGLCDGSASLSGSGGTAPYTYKWITGVTISSINNLCPGTYTGTVRDANNCVLTDSIIITQPIELRGQGTMTNITCNGLCNGAVGINGTGGTGTYTYKWLTGATTSIINNLCVGFYTVTIRDANNCFKEASLKVKEPAILKITSTQTNATCNELCNAAIDITTSGGTEPYTYMWSNGATTQDLFDICAGTYTDIVRDTNNCLTAATVTITQPEFDIPNGQTIVPGVTATWDTTLWHKYAIMVKGTIVIKDGATLKIQGTSAQKFTVKLDDSSSIIVEAGGKLITDNVFLTNIANCSMMWDGVQLLDLPSYKGGTAMFDRTTVEHAHKAILIKPCDLALCPVPIPPTPQPVNPSANIQANVVAFINNGVDIEVDPRYSSNGAYPSNLSACNFVSIAPLLDTAKYKQRGTDVHVLLQGNHSVVFGKYNVFSLTNPSQFPLGERGTGIRIINSSLTLREQVSFQDVTIGVDASSAGSIQQHIRINGSTFDNVEQGVFFSGNMSGDIRNNTFNNVRQSIYSQGSSNGRILNNDFIAIPSASLGTQGDIFGIFMVGSDGFIIENNTFNGTGPVSNPTPAPNLTGASYGIVAENTNTNLGVIFNNTFTGGLDFEFQTQYDNSQLKVRCNNFTNDGKHSWVTFDELRQQGLNCDVTKDGATPTNVNQAANEWTYCVTGNGKDIYVDRNSMGEFLYYAHQRDENSDDYITNPQKCTNEKNNIDHLIFTELNVCAGVDKTNRSCENYFDGFNKTGGSCNDQIQKMEQKIISWETQITGAKAQLRHLREQKHIVEKINQKPPMADNQLKNFLVQNMPLSNESLIALIQRKQPLPSQMLADILIPHAPLSEKVMMEIVVIHPPLPPGVQQKIDAAQWNRPLFLQTDDLQRMIAYAEGEIQLLENELLNVSDTCETKQQREQRLRISPTIESKKILAELFLQENNFIEARIMLNTVQTMTDTIWWQDSTRTLKTQKESSNYCKLMHCMVNVMESGRYFDQMNASEIQIVREVADEKIHISARAEVLLATLTGEKFEHPIKKIVQPSAKQQVSLSQQIQQNKNNVQDKTLKVYPNPASNSITVEFRLEEKQVGSFTLYNLLGEKLTEETMNNEKQRIQIGTDKMSSGIYIYVFKIYGAIGQQGKITIIK